MLLDLAERVVRSLSAHKMEEEEVLQGRSWSSMRKRYQGIMKNVEPSSLLGKSEEEILAMADSGNASSRRWGYTSEEEERILRYIVSKNEYYRVGSAALWHQMKDSAVMAAAGVGGSSLRLPTSFKTQHKSAKCNPSVQLIPLRVDYGAL